MQFRFDVKISEQDYLDFNQFVLIRSPYGKKPIRSMRTMITAIFALGIVVVLLKGGWTGTISLMSVGLLLILFVLMQIFLTKIYALSLRKQIRRLQKGVKKAYSPEAIMEFGEDSLLESTPVNKGELKYSAIERVSVVENQSIYLHMNHAQAFLLPASCFESKEQYDSFVDFIKTKCANIDVY